MYKQVIVVRDDLNLSRGKLAVQVAHAAILGYEISNKEVVQKWKGEGQKKIVLKVPSLEKLLKVKKEAEGLGLPVAIVRDAGFTEVKPGTITAIVIGPEDEKKINKVTGILALLK